MREKQGQGEHETENHKTRQDTGLTVLTPPGRRVPVPPNIQWGGEWALWRPLRTDMGEASRKDQGTPELRRPWRSLELWRPWQAVFRQTWDSHSRRAGQMNGWQTWLRIDRQGWVSRGRRAWLRSGWRTWLRSGRRTWVSRSRRAGQMNGRRTWLTSGQQAWVSHSWRAGQMNSRQTWQTSGQRTRSTHADPFHAVGETKQKTKRLSKHVKQNGENGRRLLLGLVFCHEQTQGKRGDER